MNNYETVFIATPVLSDVQFKELVSKFQGIITENGGQIVHSEDWGLRKLAYPIQKKSTGFYYLIQFQSEGDLIDKLEIQYRRDEKVIRFLTFGMDKHAVAYAIKRISKNKENAEAAKNNPVESTEEIVETTEKVKSEKPAKPAAKKKVVEEVVEIIESVKNEKNEVVEEIKEVVEVVENIESNENKEA